MTSLFIHGGPGLNDYLSWYFRPAPHRRFYSQAKGALGVDAAVNELAEQTKSIIGDVVLVAHSWGGVIALEYCRRELQPRPKALVLISTPITHRCEEDFQEECEKRGFIQPSMQDVFLSTDEQEDDFCKEQLTRIFADFDPASLNNVQAYMNTFDLSPELHDPELPTLVIAGEDDVRVPARVQRQYPRNAGHVQYFEIPGAGHFPFLRPDDLLQVEQGIEDFLRDL